MDNKGHDEDGATAKIPDVARHFNVSEKTVRRWIENTDIPHRRIGGTIRFNLEEVDAWASASTVITDQPAAGS